MTLKVGFGVGNGLKEFLVYRGRFVLSKVTIDHQNFMCIGPPDLPWFSDSRALQVRWFKGCGFRVKVIGI